MNSSALCPAVCLIDAARLPAMTSLWLSATGISFLTKIRKTTMSDGPPTKKSRPSYDPPAKSLIHQHKQPSVVGSSEWHHQQKQKHAEFRKNLPVYARRKDILRLVATKDVVLVVAETVSITTYVRRLWKSIASLFSVFDHLGKWQVDPNSRLFAWKRTAI